MRGRLYAFFIFVGAMAGVLLALAFRNKFDGVAFLFAIIAGLAFIVEKLLANRQYFDDLRALNDSINDERTRQKNRDAAHRKPYNQEEYE